jgi:hypothetical protein
MNRILVYLLMQKKKKKKKKLNKNTSSNTEPKERVYGSYWALLW